MPFQLRKESQQISNIKFILFILIINLLFSIVYYTTFYKAVQLLKVLLKYSVQVFVIIKSIDILILNKVLITGSYVVKLNFVDYIVLLC